MYSSKEQKKKKLTNRLPTFYHAAIKRPLTALIYLIWNAGDMSEGKFQIRENLSISEKVLTF